MNLTSRKLFSTPHSHGLLSLTSGYYLLLSVLINQAFGYNQAMGIELSLMYSFALFCLFCLLARINLRFHKVFLALWTITAACYYPFGHAYGAPNFNSMLALHSTNVAEASEMLRIFPWSDYLVSLFMLFVGWLALRQSHPPYKKWSHLYSLLVVINIVVLVWSPLNGMRTGWPFKLVDTGYPIVRFVKDIVNSKMEVDSELVRMRQLSQLQDSWHVVNVAPKQQVYVLVIGESARRDAQGAFGGQWDNTPFASRVNGTFFQNYISAASSTQKSLGLMLNLVKDGTPEYQNNIITLAKRAGFQTYWFSNQGQIGQYDTVIASIAKHSDEVRFMKTGNFDSDVDVPDVDLLRFTPDALKAPGSVPKLLVYHLMGSHPKACARTHNQYRDFVDTKEISCYLYSMTQTDAFLEQLHQQLVDSGQSFSMIYFSDHGLAFKERGTTDEYLAHGDEFQQNFQVPLFIVSSTDKQRSVINAARSANDFLSLFSDWTGIHSSEVKSTYNFISEQPAPPLYITTFELKKIDYSQLPQDPFVAKPATPTAGLQTAAH